MSQHLSNTSKTAYILISHISSTRHLLATQATWTLVCSLVLLQLDCSVSYCQVALSTCWTNFTKIWTLLQGMSVKLRNLHDHIILFSVAMHTSCSVVIIRNSCCVVMSYTIDLSSNICQSLCCRHEQQLLCCHRLYNSYSVVIVCTTVTLSLSLYNSYSVVVAVQQLFSVTQSSSLYNSHSVVIFV